MKNLQVLIQEYINVVKLNEVWLREEIGTVQSPNRKPVPQLKELLVRSRHQRKKIEELIDDLQHFDKLCKTLNVDTKKIFIDDTAKS